MEPETRRFTLLFALVLWLFVHPGYVLGQLQSDARRAQEVLDSILSNRTERLESFSVDGLLTVAKYRKNREIGLQEYVFRKSTGTRDGKPFARLDLRIEDVINPASNFIYEHDLACNDFIYHGVDLKPGGNVRRYERDNFPALDTLINLRPEYLCFFASKSGFGIPASKARSVLAEMNVFDAEWSLDRLSMRVVHSSGVGGNEFQFRQFDKSWFLLQSSSRSSASAPVDPLSYKGNGFDKWSVYARARCIWAEVDKGLWLPQIIMGATEQQNFDDETQLVLGNWKLADDVLVENFNPELFTSDRLQKDVDFESIRDKLKAQLDRAMLQR